MNMFKKLVSLTLCVFVALGAVACGSAPASGPEPSPSASGSTSESQATSEVEGEKDENGMYPDQAWEQLTAQYEAPVAITLWVPNSATSTMGAGIQMLADEFNAQQEKEHPGKNITVTVEYQDKSRTLNEKLQAAILSGNNPVISAVGVSSVPLYASKAVDLRTVFTYEALKAQNQGMLQYSMYGGKFVVNPYFPSASNILVVNRTLMDEKGVDVPTAQSILDDPEASGWTWKAFHDAAKTATDAAAGVYGFATNSLDPIGMMYQQGGSLYNEDVTEIAFEGDDRFAKGLEFWRSLVTDGCMIDPNSRANHGTIIVSEFYEQKVGMIYTTSSNLASFSKGAAANGYELEALPFPKQTQFFTNQGGSGFIILDNKPQEEIEAAAEFLRWMNLPENNAKMCAMSGYLPLTEEAMEQPELQEVYETAPMLKTAAQFMQFGIPSPQGKAKAACDKAVNDYAKLIWSEPEMSIEEIVSQVTEKVKFEIEANQ